MNLEEAKARVLERLAARRVGWPDGVAFLEDKTVPKPYGWILYYNSKQYVESGDIMTALVGQGPVAVVAATGEIHELGSADPPAVAIRALEKELKLR